MKKQAESNNFRTILLPTKKKLLNNNKWSKEKVFALGTMLVLLFVFQKLRGRKPEEYDWRIIIPV